MKTRLSAAPAVLAGVILLAGCSAVDSKTEEKSVTWQQAKRDAQAMEREIVGLIPPDDVLNVDQHETGTLFSCDDTQHQWLGRTSVTLQPGADVERTVKKMEQDFQGDDRFVVSTWREVSTTNIWCPWIRRPPQRRATSSVRTPQERSRSTHGLPASRSPRGSTPVASSDGDHYRGPDDDVLDGAEAGSIGGSSSLYLPPESFSVLADNHKRRREQCRLRPRSRPSWRSAPRPVGPRGGARVARRPPRAVRPAPARASVASGVRRSAPTSRAATAPG